jgi:hypothetical protein
MNQNETLKVTKEALQRVIEEKKQNQELVRSIGPAIVEMLRPLLESMAENSKITREELLDAMSNMQINVPKIDMPDIRIPQTIIPEFKIPQPVVNVTVPEIKIPTKDMAETNKLLIAILKKESIDEPIDISVNLKIT